MDEQSPELKNIIEDIINKFMSYLSVVRLKDFLFVKIEKEYGRGLEAGEVGFNMNFVPSYKTISFLQNYAFDNVKGLNEEMKERLRKEMVEGLLNHETPSQLKLRIMDTMDTTIQRAEMIVRTETNRAFNIGHFEAAKESGLDLVKQWSTHEDERTCEVCNGLDNQIVGMNDKFKTIKGDELLLSPAHPRCRCRVVYVQAINNI